MLQVEGGLGIAPNCPFKTVYFIAVSQTSDPRGSWNVYEFEMSHGTPFAADFTQIGLNGDAVFFSANMFGLAGRFFSEVFEANKAQMERGRANFTADGFANLEGDGPGVPIADVGPFLADTVQPVLALGGGAGGGRHDGLFVDSIDGPDMINGNLCTSPADAHATPVWSFMQPFALSELIEGAVRTGQSVLAVQALSDLKTLVLPGADWVVGLEARGRALLSEGAEARRCYNEAIDCLSRTPLLIELGRAHLLYGEWLRRDHQGEAGRDQLRRAYELFTTAGADAFAERARAELLATGEKGPPARLHDRLRPDPAGGAHREAGPGGPLQLRDRGRALHQPAHRRVALAQGVHETRHHLAPSFAGRLRPRAAELIRLSPERRAPRTDRTSDFRNALVRRGPGDGSGSDPDSEGVVAQAARARPRRPPGDGTRPPRRAVDRVLGGVGRGRCDRTGAARRAAAAMARPHRRRTRIAPRRRMRVARRPRRRSADVVTPNRQLAQTALRPWTPVFIHGDLQVDHVFIDDDEVTGVIDWSEGAQGDALSDLATLTLGHPEHLHDVIAGYGTDVDRDLIRAWWSLRCLSNIRWLAEHGYGPPEEYPELTVLRSRF